MCYEDLREGAVTERSIPALLRAERRDALINGLEAAGLVTLALLSQGVTLPLVAASALVAVALGALLHQVVLVAGAVALRARARRERRASPLR